MAKKQRTQAEIDREYRKMFPVRRRGFGAFPIRQSTSTVPSGKYTRGGKYSPI